MNLHIVTGGSRGLGAALAAFFAERGDQVAEISRSGAANHESIRSFPCDLAGGASKAAVIAEIFEKFPFEMYETISLTNNAGMVEPIKHVPDLDEESIAKNIALNLTAPIALTAAFLHATAKFRGMRVVANVSSGVAKNPKASWATYSAAKAGLGIFSAALAKDLEQDSRTKVITFEPGVIDTEMQASIRSTDQSDFDEIDRFVRLKREGQLLAPEKVAGVLGNLILDPHLKPLNTVSVYDRLG